MNIVRYLVAGLGKTGLSCARYLQRRELSFSLFDSRENPPGLADFKREFPEVPCYLSSLPPKIMVEFKAIITSPGISLELPLFKEARANNIPIYGDIECLAREIQAPVIAITGTNGKSTVTALVGEMAAAAGFKVAVAGNIGQPVLEKLDDGQSYDLWILELSSFQLELTQSLAPIAATILNISADHLDRHHNLTNYIAAKQSIYLQAKAAVYNRHEIHTYPIKTAGSLISFGDDAPLEKHWGLINKNNIIYLAKGTVPFMPVTDLKIKGEHNWQNALAACALAELAGIKAEYQKKVLSNFSGLAHRCQWVRTLNNVDWINDSKGTNIGATISAVMGIGTALTGKIILIAGGQGKGANFKDLRLAVEKYVRVIIVIGEDADKIAQALADIVMVIKAKNLGEAVLCAETQALPKDVVLLSPACASLDMFKDFNHRGEIFTQLVQEL